MKTCKKCRASKPLESFPKHAETRDGRTGQCWDCKNKWQRERRVLRGNADTRKYEKTKPGFLMRVYRNMESRVTGIQRQKSHLYLGLPLLERDAFYAWANESPEFNRLFSEWEETGYQRSWAPTVDRLDSSRGYELGNMQWVRMSINCGLANLGRRRSPNSALRG